MAGLHDIVAEIYQFIGDWVSINKDTVWSLGDVWWRMNMLNGRSELWGVTLRACPNRDKPLRSWAFSGSVVSEMDKIKERTKKLTQRNTIHLRVVR
jgi:hypothetical protein